MERSPSVDPIMIYLAGRIDGVDRREAIAWREEVGELAISKICFFSPAHAFFGTSADNFPAVEYSNRMMIANCCHGVLANLQEGLAFGTIREIEFARTHDRPVAVVGDIGGSLMAHDLIMSETLEDGVADLVRVIADKRQQIPTIFGYPLTQLRPMTEDELDEGDQQ